MTILVTGSTGQLGSRTLTALKAAGHATRGVSRRGRDGSTVADLLTGQGVDEAMAGVSTVVHCAQTASKRDLQMAENLAAAAKRAGVSHLVLISIVGIERIPLSYYTQRVKIEQIAARSDVPLTIQRATQFHSLVDSIFSAQRYLPMIFAPSARFQSISVHEVADRLTKLATGEPKGRVDDIGGPEQRGVRELFDEWKKARGIRRGMLRFRFPVAAFTGLDEGANLVSGTPYGTQTFAEYLREKYERAL